MTSEVMGNVHPSRQGRGMRFLIYLAVLIAFTAYSVTVVLGHGYLGFLTLAWREPWAMQMLLDLCIALSVATGWLIQDARRRGVNPWPFVGLVVAAGSVGVLAYLCFTRRFLSGSSRAP